VSLKAKSVPAGIALAQDFFNNRKNSRVEAHVSRKVLAAVLAIAWERGWEAGQRGAESKSPEPKGKGAVGAIVRYCGHAGTFVADILEVAGACVVHAGGPITMDNLNRDPSKYAKATYQLVDFPNPIFWNPKLGVFVVPADNVTVLK